MRLKLFAAILGGILVGGVIMGAYYFLKKEPVISYQEKLETVMPSITAQPQPDAEISAWIAWWDEDNSLKSLSNNENRLKRIMPMWYRLNKKGEMEEITESKKRQEIENKAKGLGMEIMPTISNDFDPDATSALLDNFELQTKIIDEFVNIAKINNYMGWDIDWEEMYPGDRGGFSYFVRELATKLHENNLKLSVTVQARTDEATENPATKAQDWRVIGSNADEVRIMAYDFHYDESEPGAVTPIEKLEKVITVATRELPSEKIIMGMPTYGYKWGGSKGVGVQYNEAQAIINKLKTEPTRDVESAALKVEFKENNVKYEMWFEDAESFRAKVLLSKASGINKFSLWRLGGEDPGLWKIK